MENQKIQVYDYEGKQVRVINRADGSLWWVSSDIEEISGHKNIRNTINKVLDPDEISTTLTTNRAGYYSDMQVINESGFYKLMFRSTLPQAKAFTKFVTSVILPEIRRLGSYNANAPLLTEIAHDKQAVKELTDQKNAINKRLRFLKLRIEDNENAVFAPYSAGYSKQIQTQTAEHSYQMELGFKYENNP